jgi:hypothetical protein
MTRPCPYGCTNYCSRTNSFFSFLSWPSSVDSASNWPWPSCNTVNESQKSRMVSILMRSRKTDALSVRGLFHALTISSGLCRPATMPGMDAQRPSKSSSMRLTLPFQMQIKANPPDNWQRFGRGWRDCNEAIESAKNLRKLSQDVTGKNTFASIRVVDECGKQVWIETL